MATENPKISAYVPQVVYNRFKKFQEEHKLSMSQAATKLIADYLGVDLKDETTNQMTNELSSRITQIEQELKELKQIYQDLSEKFDGLQITKQRKDDSCVASDSKESIDKLRNKTDNDSSKFNSELLSEPPNEIQSELLGDQSSRFDNESIEQIHKSASGLDSEPKSRLPIQLNLEKELSEEIAGCKSKPESSPKSELLKEHDIKFDRDTLAGRLNVKPRYMDNKKSELTSEEFIKWTSEKDPDEIGWMSTKEKGRVFYVPVGTLTSELISRLLQKVNV